MLIDLLPPERLSALLAGEARRCAASGVDWRALVLARHVLQVPQSQQPTPDGLSADYIKLAHALGIKHRTQDGSINQQSALLCLVGELIQAELAAAILNERDLMADCVK